MKKGGNIFLTGCAGSGKTHLLRDYIRFLREKEIGVAVTASTGIAATHLSGTTIHSFTGMGILDDLSREDLKKILRKRYLLKKIKATKVLIIDEVSMLSATQLDIANVILQNFLQNDQPFGGLQVILCGDFFQLPPIKRKSGLYGGSSDFAYSSKSWKDLNLKICYLTEQHRHKGGDLEKVLNAIRDNTVDEKMMEILRSRYQADIGGGEHTKLYTHNADVDRINYSKLTSISSTAKTFDMRKSGLSSVVNSFVRQMLAPETLEIKEGAVVMFVKNGFEKGYVNGTLGTVIGFRDGFPLVKTTKGKKIVATPERWLVEDVFGDEIASVEQVPLRLAWAITVHKSQGTTIDRAEIDLGSAFELGMGYVALSRIRTVEGLRLMGLNEKALMVSEEVREMDSHFREVSRKGQ